MWSIQTVKASRPTVDQGMNSLVHICFTQAVSLTWKQLLTDRLLH